jgi:hypothetical protein
MSRPKLVSAVGVNVKIEVPAGWFATISIVCLIHPSFILPDGDVKVSRKAYNQLVTIEYDADLGKDKVFFANIIKNNGVLADAMMKHIVSTEDLLPIAPQEDPYVIELNAYFSKTPSIRKEKLANDKYKSNRLNIMTVSVPSLQISCALTALTYVEQQTYCCSSRVSRLHNVSCERYDFIHKCSVV